MKNEDTFVSGQQMRNAEEYAVRTGFPIHEFTPTGVKFDTGNVLQLLSHQDIEDALKKAVTNIVVTPVGYESLALVFNQALRQASAGKGHERHANNQPFEQQRMQMLTREYGLGFALGQAAKKSAEAQDMAERGAVAPAQFELLGAINYLAGAYLYLDSLGGEHGTARNQ